MKRSILGITLFVTATLLSGCITHAPARTVHVIKPYPTIYHAPYYTSDSNHYNYPVEKTYQVPQRHDDKRDLRNHGRLDSKKDARHDLRDDKRVSRPPQITPYQPIRPKPPEKPQIQPKPIKVSHPTQPASRNAGKHDKTRNVQDHSSPQRSQESREDKKSVTRYQDREQNRDD